MQLNIKTIISWNVAFNFSRLIFIFQVLDHLNQQRVSKLYFQDLYLIYSPNKYDYLLKLIKDCEQKLLHESPGKM